MNRRDFIAASAALIATPSFTFADVYAPMSININDFALSTYGINRANFRTPVSAIEWGDDGISKVIVLSGKDNPILVILNKTLRFEMIPIKTYFAAEKNHYSDMYPLDVVGKYYQNRIYFPSNEARMISRDLILKAFPHYDYQ